jgi:hypothetical protein
MLGYTADRVMVSLNLHLFVMAYRCSSAAGSEETNVNPHRNVNPQCDQISAGQYRQTNQRRRSSLSLAGDSFDIWWQKFLTHHDVIAAQASALMQAHQRVSGSRESRVNQAL